MFLIAAFVAAGLLHSAWLRSARSRRLAIPLDFGRTFRGRRIFGANKTVRGFTVMVPGAALCFAGLATALTLLNGALPQSIWQLSTTAYALLGAWAGLGFMLAELPNSFLKRQLGIAPGDAPAGRAAMIVCFFIDRCDSIVGMLVAVTIAVPTSWATWGWVMLLGPAIHWSFSVLLYHLGVKARPA